MQMTGETMMLLVAAAAIVCGMAFIFRKPSGDDAHDTDEGPRDKPEERQAQPRRVKAEDLEGFYDNTGERLRDFDLPDIMNTGEIPEEEDQFRNILQKISEFEEITDPKERVKVLNVMSGFGWMPRSQADSMLLDLNRRIEQLATEREELLKKGTRKRKADDSMDGAPSLFEDDKKAGGEEERERSEGTAEGKPESGDGGDDFFPADDSQQDGYDVSVPPSMMDDDGFQEGSDPDAEDGYGDFREDMDFLNS